MCNSEKKSTHYEVLELDKGCTNQQIKDSFIKLSKKYHPDINKSSEAHKKFIQVNEAYSVLGKNQSRRLYDDSLTNSPPPHYRDTENPPRSYTYNHYYYGSSEPYTHGSYYNRDTRGSIHRHRMPLLICLISILCGTGFQIYNERRKMIQSTYNSRVAAIMYAHAKDRVNRIGSKQALQEYIDGSYEGVSFEDVKEEVEKANIRKP